jgi:hypothetical protein
MSQRLREKFHKAQFKVATFSSLVILLLFISSPVASFHANAFSASQPSSTAKNPQASSLVYIWFFGYIGNEYYPQMQLGLTQAQVLAAASNLSSTIGKQNLVLLTSVDEIPTPDGSINKSMIPTIAAYVSSLKQYAIAVWGRLDFYQFNLTSQADYGNCALGGGSGPWSDCPIYNQTSLYVNQLHLDGIWFDHPSQYYQPNCIPKGHVCGIGPQKFNLMMQNLTTLFPNTAFMLNQAPGGKFGYVQQISGDCGSVQCTWASHTYASPSPPQKSLALNQQELQTENNLFPGHLIAHLDAEGPIIVGTSPYEPMSIFADESNAREVSAMQALLYNSTHPAQPNEGYSMVIPFLGAWTCDCVAYGTSGPNYGGGVYNALSIGNNARSTATSFLQLIQNGNLASISMTPATGSYGQKVSLSGSGFMISSKVTIKFDGQVLRTVSTNTRGGFSASFIVPKYAAGGHTVQVTDGQNTALSNFVVTPKITQSPSSGLKGTFVLVNLYGFGSHSNVWITFNGKQVIFVTANLYGGYSNASYNVPSFPPGTYTIKATDSDGNTFTTSFSETS